MWNGVDNTAFFDSLDKRIAGSCKQKNNNLLLNIEFKNTIQVQIIYTLCMQQKLSKDPIYAKKKISVF